MTIVLPFELKVQTATDPIPPPVRLYCPAHVFPPNESCFTVWMDPRRTRAAMFESAGEKTTNYESLNEKVVAPGVVS